MDNEWKRAIIEGLIVAEIYRNEHETMPPKQALEELISWHTGWTAAINSVKGDCGCQ